MSIEIVWISPAWKAGRLHHGKMDWYSVDLNDSLRGAFEEISLNSSCGKPHIVFWLTFQSVLYFFSSCLERFQWKVAGISSVFVSEVFLLTSMLSELGRSTDILNTFALNRCHKPKIQFCSFLLSTMANWCIFVRLLSNKNVLVHLAFSKEEHF